MSIWTPAPEPPTALGRYRQLSPIAGVHVSPLCLGAMSIGDKWNAFMGSMNKDASFNLLDAYYNAGGNFIDTANSYQDETSEAFVGEWMESRGVRDQIIIATKYSTNFKQGQDVKIKANYTGNNLKSMNVSVDASLKKLRTNYIDLLYVHWWDYETSVEEVMNGLHNLVTQGKVLYLGISDAPAWVVAQANTYAKTTGKTPFVVYQGLWNVMSRDFERDIIPMCRSFGLALAPWNVIGGGRLRTDEEEERRRKTGENGRTMLGPEWERNEVEKKISRALEKVAKEVGTQHITAVAIAYVMQKTTHVFPIIGGRKVEHLMANIEALSIALTEVQIKELEAVIPFDAGFPHNFLGDGTFISTKLLGLGTAACFDKQPVSSPIRPK